MVGENGSSRPVVKDDRDELVAPIIGGLKELTFGTPGLFQDRPGFIAGGGSTDPFPSAVRALTQFNCRRWAASDKSGFSSRVNTGNAALCGPYLDSLGENPPDGDVGPQFEGGQCGLAYLFLIKAEALPGDPLGLVNANFYVRGPIAGWRTAKQNGSVVIYVTAHSGPRTSCGAVPASQGLAERVVATVQDRPRKGFTGSVVSVCGGLPDNCGNPQPVIKPPGTTTPSTPIPPRISINIPGFGPVNVTVNPDVDGDPEICFEEIGTCVTVKPEITVDGGEPAPTPPGDNPETAPPIDGPNDGNGGGGGGENDFGEPPEGRIWIGAIVEILGDMRSFGIVPDTEAGNAVSTKVIGNASLIIPGPSGGSLRTEATQIRSRWSDHFLSVVGLTSTGIRVNINPMVRYRVWPVSINNPNKEGTDNG